LNGRLPSEFLTPLGLYLMPCSNREVKTRKSIFFDTGSSWLRKMIVPFTYDDLTKFMSIREANSFIRVENILREMIYSIEHNNFFNLLDHQDLDTELSPLNDILKRGENAYKGRMCYKWLLYMSREKIGSRPKSSIVATIHNDLKECAFYTGDVQSTLSNNMEDVLRYAFPKYNEYDGIIGNTTYNPYSNGENSRASEELRHLLKLYMIAKASKEVGIDIILFEVYTASHLGPWKAIQRTFYGNPMITGFFISILFSSASLIISIVK
jgi:hypothetical protein